MKQINFLSAVLVVNLLIAIVSEWNLTNIIIVMINSMAVLVLIGLKFHKELSYRR